MFNILETDEQRADRVAAIGTPAHSANRLKGWIYLALILSVGWLFEPGAKHNVPLPLLVVTFVSGCVLTWSFDVLQKKAEGGVRLPGYRFALGFTLMFTIVVTVGVIIQIVVTLGWVGSRLP